MASPPWNWGPPSQICIGPFIQCDPGLEKGKSTTETVLILANRVQFLLPRSMEESQRRNGIQGAQDLAPFPQQHSLKISLTDNRHDERLTMKIWA